MDIIWCDKTSYDNHSGPRIPLMLQLLSILWRFSILTREVNNSKLKIMESLPIARDKPCLNKADSSLPLELFWYNIVVIIWCFITSYDVIYHLVRIHLSFVHSFKYYVMIFVFFMIFVCYDYFANFRKLAVNKWVCGKKLWLFSWLF